MGRPTKSLSLQPLLKWPGGKSRMAKKLTRLLPKHSTYVEPFAGGAAVFFHKPMVKKNVIGDYDPWLIDFYKSVRNGGLAKCSLGYPQSRALYYKAKKNQRSACNKMIVSHQSFHGTRDKYIGDGTNYKGKIINRNLLQKHALYKKKLRKSYVRLSDFAVTMRKFDGLDTVHFLDPPWVLDYSDRYYKGGKKATASKERGKKYKNTSFDPNRIKKVADGMKGYVMIITNNDRHMKRLFCGSKGWKCSYIKAYVNKWKNGKHGMFIEKQLLMRKGFGALAGSRKKKAKS